MKKVLSQSLCILLIFTHTLVASQPNNQESNINIKVQISFEAVQRLADQVIDLVKTQNSSNTSQVTLNIDKELQNLASNTLLNDFWSSLLIFQRKNQTYVNKKILNTQTLIIALVINIVAMTALLKHIFGTDDGYLLAVLLFGPIVGLCTFQASYIAGDQIVPIVQTELAYKKFETLFWNQLEKAGIKVLVPFRELWLNQVLNGQLRHSKVFESKEQLVKEVDRFQRFIRLFRSYLADDNEIRALLENFETSIPDVTRIARIKKREHLKNALVDFINVQEIFKNLHSELKIKNDEANSLYSQYLQGISHLSSTEVLSELSSLDEITKKVMIQLDQQIWTIELAKLISIVKSKGGQTFLNIGFEKFIPVRDKLTLGIMKMNVKLEVIIDGNKSSLEMSENFNSTSNYIDAVIVSKTYQQKLIETLNQLTNQMIQKVQGDDFIVLSQDCLAALDNSPEERSVPSTPKLSMSKM